MSAISGFLGSAHKTGEKPTITEEKLVNRNLLTIKRCMYGILLLHACFVLTLVISVIIIYMQLQKYTAANSNNINAMVMDAKAMMDNAALMTAAAVPITTNFEFMSNAMAASVASMVNASVVNSTATQARLETGRHLLSMQANDVPVTEQQLMRADLKSRQLLYSMTRKILQNVENATSGFQISNVNDILHAVGHTNWEEKLGKRYDRVMSDIEEASGFMTLSMEAISAVALAKGINLTAVSDSLFKSSKPSASPAAIQSACNS
jgi:hypothetical protein